MKNTDRLWIQKGGEAGGYVGRRDSSPRFSALPVLSNFELLLKNWRSSADPLPSQGNIYYDTVDDLDEGNVSVHAVVFAIEGHSAVDAPSG